MYTFASLRYFVCYGSFYSLLMSAIFVDPESGKLSPTPSSSARQLVTGRHGSVSSASDFGNSSNIYNNSNSIKPSGPAAALKAQTSQSSQLSNANPANQVILTPLPDLPGAR